jgi:hypothetical protein
MILEVNPLLVVGAAVAPTAALLVWISYSQGRKSGYRLGKETQKKTDEEIVQGYSDRVEIAKQDFLSVIKETIQAAAPRPRHSAPGVSHHRPKANKDKDKEAKP